MKQKKSGSGRRIVCLVLAAVMLLGLISSALIIMVNAASSSEIKKELTGLRNQQAELKKERDALQAKIKENQSKTQSLVDKKSDIDQQINMTLATVDNLNKQVQQYSLLIANKQSELEASQAEEQRLNEQYKTRIRSMEETGNISYWAILFGANSFSDLLDKIDVIQEIAKADQLMLDKMKAVSEKIASERTELEQQLAELDTTRDELDQQEQELHLPEELLRARIGRDEGNAVARLQAERAGGDMDLLLPALDRADQDLCLCNAGQLHQCPARQRRIRRKLEFQKLHLAAEEGIGLDGRRDTQRPRHLRRADELRVDGQAQAQIVGNERQLIRIFRVPDAGNGMLRTDLLCDKAAQQIQLILRRHRDDQLRLVNACFKLRGIRRAVSLDAQNVQILNRPLQRRTAAVDNGDLMPLARKLLRQCAADLSVAHDHDPHVLNSFFSHPFRICNKHCTTPPAFLQPAPGKAPVQECSLLPDAGKGGILGYNIGRCHYSAS